jgi:hypothetical protein
VGPVVEWRGNKEGDEGHDITDVHESRYENVTMKYIILYNKKISEL